MSTRDTLTGIVRQWTERNGGAPETPEAVVDAYRAEVLREAAEIVLGAFHGEPFLNYPPDFADLLREKAGEKSTATSGDATPDFFQVGHTYVREHHASTIRFLVRYIDDSPEGIPYQVAFGWRTEDGDVCASPFDSDDFTGWIDVTEAGESR